MRNSSLSSEFKMDGSRPVVTRRTRAWSVCTAGTENAGLTAVSMLGLVLGLLNVLLGLVNLVPAYPLDGGRLFRAIVWARTGSERTGSRFVGRSGSAIGVALMIGGAFLAVANEVGNGLMVLLSGWFLRLTARGALQRVQLEELADGLRVGDVMEPLPTTISPGLTVDTFADQLLEGEPPQSAVLVSRGGEVVEGVALPLVDLPSVLDQHRSGEGFSEGPERSTGVDLGQLRRVPH